MEDTKLCAESELAKLLKYCIVISNYRSKTFKNKYFRGFPLRVAVGLG